MFWLVPLGGLVAAVVAVPVGLVALRVRRHTFVVMTIALFFIFQLVASNLASPAGRRGSMPQPDGRRYLQRPLLLRGPGDRRVRHGRAGVAALGFGLQLLAIRDDEDRALGLGVRVGPVKVVAFVMSAF